MTYDTIIIGGGPSGLAAGIRLAYFDRSVCLLERHTTIGGLNSFYRLRDRNFDVGLHAVTNYADPGTKTGPLSKLLRQLRLDWSAFDLKPQIGSSIVFPEHTLQFTNDFALFEDQVRRAFPDQIDRFRELCHKIQEHDALNLSRQSLSARQVVGEFLTNDVLIDMLFCPLMFYGSATPHDMDFSQFVIMFKSVLCEGFGRPYAGVRPIFKHLVRKFKSEGGELRLRAGVQQIDCDGQRALGVTLDDGTQLQARNILSSAGAAETLQMCHDASQDTAQPPLSMGRVVPGEISFVESISVLDCQPAELGHDQTIVFYNNAERFQYRCPTSPIDARSGIICSPNNFQYEAPLDEGRIRITALASPDCWMELPETDYVTQKHDAAQQMAASAVRFMPDFRDHIVDLDVFTPRTIRKFTGHLNGCVYGAPHKHVDGRTPLENLYLCGSDQGFLGIVGAMLSGITIANGYLLQ